VAATVHRYNTQYSLEVKQFFRWPKAPLFSCVLTCAVMWALRVSLRRWWRFCCSAILFLIDFYVRSSY